MAAVNSLTPKGVEDANTQAWNNFTKGLSDTLWGKSSTTQASTLNEGQQDVLNMLISGSKAQGGDLFNRLGGLSSNAPNAYNALPNFEQTFNEQYGNPLRQQYEGDLRNIANSAELRSGGNLAQNFRAMQQFNTGLASARAQMLMAERDKQMKSTENSYNRQLQASQLLAALTQAPLGVKSFENITTREGGLLSGIANIGTAAEGLGKGIASFAGLGGKGSGNFSGGSEAEDMAALLAGI